MDSHSPLAARTAGELTTATGALIKLCETTLWTFVGVRDFGFPRPNATDSAVVSRHEPSSPQRHGHAA